MTVKSRICKPGLTSRGDDPSAEFWRPRPQNPSTWSTNGWACTCASSASSVAPLMSQLGNACSKRGGSCSQSRKINWRSAMLHLVVGDRISQGRGSHRVFFRFQYPLLAAAVAIPLFALYSYPYASNSAMAAGLEAYLSWYARIVGSVISAIDSHVVVSGNRIAGPMFSMSIVQTCDAMEVTILLVAALAAFPMPVWRRAVAVPGSVLFLMLINIARLCVLYWLGVHSPGWFNRTHETLAPLCLVACAVAFFLGATLGAKGSFCGRSVQGSQAS